MIRETTKARYYLATEDGEVSWSDDDAPIAFQFPLGTSTVLTPQGAHELATMLRRAAKAKGYAKAEAKPETAPALPVAPAAVAVVQSPPPPPAPPSEPVTKVDAPAAKRGAQVSGAGAPPPAHVEARPPAAGTAGGVPGPKVSAGVAPPRETPRSKAPRDFVVESASLKERINDAKLPGDVLRAHDDLTWLAEEGNPEELQLELVRFFNLVHPTFRR